MEMKIGKPISESKIPAASSGSRSKHTELYEQIMKLEDGKVLPIEIGDHKQAVKFAFTLSHTTYAKFRSWARGETVYVRLWNEEDEKRKQHIMSLREKARAKKQPAPISKVGT